MSMYNQSSNIPLEYAPSRDLTMMKFFNQVYAWMFVGLAVTGVTGFLSRGFIISNPFVAVAAMLAMVLMAWGTRSVAMRLSAAAGLAMFIAYAAMVGVVISYVFVRYNLETLAGAFCVTGGVFAGMSVVGFVLKKNLSGLGGVLFMAVWGLFLASLFNIFFASNALSWVITYGVLVVFVALTAYDTQKLKLLAEQHADQPAMLQRIAVIGSLELYLDFINLFLSILRIMGSRK